MWVPDHLFEGVLPILPVARADICNALSDKVGFDSLCQNSQELDLDEALQFTICLRVTLSLTQIHT